MPSADRRQTLTKRQLLAVCGSCAGVGTLGGYAYGSGFFRDDCNPTPLDTSPADWPLPSYDEGNTRAVPSEHAPENGLSETWSVGIRNPEQLLVLNGSVFVVPEVPPAEFITSYDLSTGEERWVKPVSIFKQRENPAVHGGRESLNSERIPPFTAGVNRVTRLRNPQSTADRIPNRSY
ncbi:hypothetical protein SAMN04489842_1218 [Natronobacterium texcoconense]|uniref:PQQ-like domain-containing protein n=1 Tax=Natronobacterium texcoconense TaxID=1095778 RepID=A0A1H1C073_NATTX|nr:hypothetical protein SAMN04489842_1218 [Natronobacterium texcoconense]